MLCWALLIESAAMLAIQVKHRLQKGQTMYLASLFEVKPDVLVEVPDEIVDVLKEFAS